MKYINFAKEEVNNEANLKISLETALESIVLLKNDNDSLPLKTKTIDLFGNGAKHTVKCGLGSGEVNDLFYVSIYDALKEAGYNILTLDWLNRYDIEYNLALKEYKKVVRNTIYHFDFINFMAKKIDFIPKTIVKEEDIKSDTCIYVISRLSGEGSDVAKIDYTISKVEYDNLVLCSKKYKNLILIINVGGFFDLSFVDEIKNINSIINMGNLGVMGSYAIEKILSGISPSGKIPFTIPNKYEDIPYSNEFSYNSNSLDSNYKEGIYVGYRYYDTFNKSVRYPFGYGLSYSNFNYDNFKYNTNNSIINISFDVKNIGKYNAKNTVLLFLKAPKEIGEEKSLVGYAKTKELAIKEKTNINIKFDLFDFAYTYNNKKMLKKGVYIIYYGDNALEVSPIYKFYLDEDFILDEVINLSNFKDELSKKIEVDDIKLPKINLDLKYENKFNELDNDFSLIKDLKLKDKINLCVGSGLLPKSNYLSIPGVAGYTTPRLKNTISLAMVDGPAGIRLSSYVKVCKNGKAKPITPAMNIYNYLPGIIKFFRYSKDNKNKKIQYATSYPTGISLASTFNNELINKVGKSIASELESLNISYYLAPAINIIKNPIGGRSFEYYSEDPYLAGMVAASIVNGIQKNNNAYAVLKHFCCNNLEFKRNMVSANVSNMALRDIYLKAFYIAIKYSNVKVIMSSYNKVNNKYVANDYNLLNDVLRREFKFNGMVMTDWLSTANNFAKNDLAIKAGNDLIMPGSRSAYKAILKAYKKGIITDIELNRAARNVYKSIIEANVYKKYNNK